MKRSAATILSLLGMLVIMGAVCSCSRVQYIPVETVKRDSLYINKLVRDSVFVKDSVMVVKGDTVTEYRYRYVYKYVGKTDTLYVEKVDTVNVPYPVEKQLSKWERIKMDAGGYALFAIIITVLVTVGRLFYKLVK